MNTLASKILYSSYVIQFILIATQYSAFAWDNLNTPCSTNLECRFLAVALTNRTICAPISVSCSLLKSCSSNSMTCTDSCTICVLSTWCGRNVCYPKTFTDSIICPPFRTTTTTTTKKTTTKTTTKKTTIKTTTKTTIKTTTTSITTTSTVETATIRAFWNMDFHFNDTYNVYNGIGWNNPGFVERGYNGRGGALSVSRSNHQYVIIPTFLNMTYTSMTWEVWGYLTNANSWDIFILGMCESYSQDRCYVTIVREGYAFSGFWADDCGSSAVVSTNEWHHFAFVYDYERRAQLIYFDGVLSGSSYASGPYLGEGGTLTIGGVHDGFYGPDSWTGYLDDISYVSRAKRSEEILRDATLVAHYSFENELFRDSGPNRIDGTGVGLKFSSGRFGKAILMNGSNNYFTASGFTLLGSIYRPYTISLWIYRSSPSKGNGTILHMSSTGNGTSEWCLPIVGLTSTYRIVGQNLNINNVSSVIGPVIPLSNWVNIVTTYSRYNGVGLWVNGTFIGSTGYFSHSSSNTSNTIILGSGLLDSDYCAHGAVVKGQFYGMMDELQIYSRELTATEIISLANA